MFAELRTKEKKVHESSNTLLEIRLIFSHQGACSSCSLQLQSDGDDYSDDEEAEEEEAEEEEEDMAPPPPARHQAPPAAARARAPSNNSPRRNAAAARDSGDDVNNLAGLFSRAVSLRPPFQSFNFAYRFPVIFTVTGTLAGGNMAVYADYFVPTMHLSQFHPELSEDGMVINMAMSIPGTFMDMAFRATSELNPNNEDSVAFVSAFRTTTGVIALAHPDFESVTPPGQEDTLPFPCQQRIRVTHVLHAGDDLLYHQFSMTPHFNAEARRQLYPFIRVELRSLEVARVGGAFVDVGASPIYPPRQSMNGVNGGGGGGGGGGVPPHGGAPGGGPYNYGGGGGGQ